MNPWFGIVELTSRGFAPLYKRLVEETAEAIVTGRLPLGSIMQSLKERATQKGSTVARRPDSYSSFRKGWSPLVSYADAVADAASELDCGTAAASMATGAIKRGGIASRLCQ